MEEKKATEYTPSEYFENVKNKKQSITDEELLAIYDNCLELLNTYKITGQIDGMKKLIFHLECIETERELVKMGINTFIYRDDIEKYIDDVSKNTVKIIELEHYERAIPDEIVEIIKKVKDKFDQLYIVFTDYTGEVEKKVAKERRDKDPILFGTFQNENAKAVVDRFYFLGDWEDEYCDLTLDKMVNAYKKHSNYDIVRTIKTPKDVEELKNQLYQLKPLNGKLKVSNDSKFSFKKVRTFLHGTKWSK